jgi:hypothetical protein
VGAGCPDVRGRMVCMACGTVVDLACRRARCGWCGRVLAMQLAGAMADALPERLVTLTQVGRTWPDRRRRMYQVASAVRGEVGPFEWAWAVEPNPKRTGFHVHAVQHGAFVPVRALSRIADYYGAGRVVDVRAMHHQEAGTAYLVKLAGEAYGMKSAMRGQLEEYLDANGGRLLHTSRGFWRDEGGAIGGARPRRVAVARSVDRRYPEARCIDRRPHVWSPVG